MTDEGYPSVTKLAILQWCPSVLLGCRGGNDCDNRFIAIKPIKKDTIINSADCRVLCVVLRTVAFFCFGGNGLFWPDHPVPIKTDPIITRSTAPTPEPNRRYPTDLPTLSLPQQLRTATTTKDIIIATAADLPERKRRPKQTAKAIQITKKRPNQKA